MKAQTQPSIWVSLLIASVAIASVMTASGCSSNTGEGSATKASAPEVSSLKTSPAKTSRAKVSSISWRRCSGGECGSMEVGLRGSDDPLTKGAKVIDLALFRVRATEPSRRVGVLLVNPGGPGGSGFDAARSLGSYLPSAITNRFDIIGWDPRGTGRSTHVRCGHRLDYLFNPDTAPDSNKERTELERAARRFADACALRSGDLLSHVSSFDTVRDMESIRRALGETKINYLGYSYGTFIGALYAREYPRHVRSMVLDGAVDPAVSQETALIEQAQGLGRALNLFFDWCDAEKSCTFGEGRSSRAYESLRQATDARPVNYKKRIFGPTQFDLGVSSYLYSGKDGYELLASALEDLASGDPRRLLESSDAYVGRSSDGTYDDSWAAFLAVSCLDGPALGDEAELAGVAERATSASKDFGAASVGLGYPCAYWRPKPLLTESLPVSAPNAPPIVVVGTRDDPITPLLWAQGLATELKSGHLVVAPGAQHTSYPSRDGCLDPIINSYFLRLRVPPDSAECPSPQVVIASGSPVI